MSCKLLNITVQTAMIKFWSKFRIQILWYSLTRDNSFLITPSQFVWRKQENLSSSTSRHINNSLSVYVFLNSELNNGGMKVQVKRTSKSYFLSPKKKKNKKVEGLASSAWNFLKLPVQVCRSAYIPFFKINALIFCCSIFFEECLNPQIGIKTMINEYNVDYHPIPLELI